MCVCAGPLLTFLLILPLQSNTGGKILWSFLSEPSQSLATLVTRVAELGSLSSGAKQAMKIFAKRVFTIFATNAPFFRAIANLQN